MPNRIIKESIRYSEKLSNLTDWQFRLWVNLITYVDDYGRGDARPAIIKGTVFPLRERIALKDIEKGLLELAGAGCVGLYEVDGKPYLYFPNWESHQRIQTKRSKFPAPTVNHGESPPESNPIRIQSESESESESEGSPPARRKHGQYGWVKLTEDEYSRLLSDLGQEELDRCITYIDESAQGNGNKNKWKDWNLVIRKCSRDGWGKQKGKAVVKHEAPAPTYDEAERVKRFLAGLKE